MVRPRKSATFATANYNSAVFALLFSSPPLPPPSPLCYYLFLSINRKNLISVRRDFSRDKEILDTLRFLVANVKKKKKTETGNVFNYK